MKPNDVRQYLFRLEPKNAQDARAKVSGHLCMCHTYILFAERYCAG